jgi:uncharacterized protein YndB with AHSA1/START domain
MAHSSAHQPDPRLDLVLERLIDVPPERVWAAWTQPDLVQQWFAPAPWTTADCEIDLRPGGIFRVLMRSPEGTDIPVTGCFLEIVPNEKLVWTDTLGPGFRPSATPFITAVIQLKRQGTGTRYQAIALHANEDVRRQHEEKGFLQGASQCLDQLVALMKNGPA